jgi:hypothetical protein
VSFQSGTDIICPRNIEMTPGGRLGRADKVGVRILIELGLEPPVPEDRRSITLASARRPGAIVNARPKNARRVTHRNRTAAVGVVDGFAYAASR